MVWLDDQVNRINANHYPSDVYIDLESLQNGESGLSTYLGLLIRTRSD